MQVKCWILSLAASTFAQEGWSDWDQSSPEGADEEETVLSSALTNLVNKQVQSQQSLKKVAALSAEDDGLKAQLQRSKSTEEQLEKISAVRSTAERVAEESFQHRLQKLSADCQQKTQALKARLQTSHMAESDLNTTAAKTMSLYKAEQHRRHSVERYTLHLKQTLNQTSEDLILVRALLGKEQSVAASTAVKLNSTLAKLGDAVQIGMDLQVEVSDLEENEANTSTQLSSELKLSDSLRKALDKEREARLAAEKKLSESDGLIAKHVAALAASARERKTQAKHLEALSAELFALQKYAREQESEAKSRDKRLQTQLQTDDKALREEQLALNGTRADLANAQEDAHRLRQMQAQLLKAEVELRTNSSAEVAALLGKVALVDKELNSAKELLRLKVAELNGTQRSLAVATELVAEATHTREKQRQEFRNLQQDRQSLQQDKQNLSDKLVGQKSAFKLEHQALMTERKARQGEERQVGNLTKELESANSKLVAVGQTKELLSSELQKVGLKVQRLTGDQEQMLADLSAKDASLSHAHEQLSEETAAAQDLGRRLNDTTSRFYEEERIDKEAIAKATDVDKKLVYTSQMLSHARQAAVTLKESLAGEIGVLKTNLTSRDVEIMSLRENLTSRGAETDGLKVQLQRSQREASQSKAESAKVFGELKSAMEVTKRELHNREVLAQQLNATKAEAAELTQKNAALESQILKASKQQHEIDERQKQEMRTLSAELGEERVDVRNEFHAHEAKLKVFDRTMRDLKVTQQELADEKSMLHNKERELSSVKSNDSQKVLEVVAKGRKEAAELASARNMLNAEKKAFDVAESQLKAQAVETAMAKRQVEAAQAKDSTLVNKADVAQAKFDYAVATARHEFEVQDARIASAGKQHTEDVSSMKVVLEALRNANETEEKLGLMVLERNHAINDLQAEIERLSSVESNYSRKSGELEVEHSNDTAKLSQVVKHAAESDRKLLNLTSKLGLAIGNASSLSAEVAQEKAAEQSLTAKISVAKKEARALRMQAAQASNEIKNLTFQVSTAAREASSLKAELKQATGLLSKDAELLKQSEDRRKRLKEKVVGKLKVLKAQNHDLEAKLAKKHSK